MSHSCWHGGPRHRVADVRIFPRPTPPPGDRIEMDNPALREVDRLRAAIAAVLGARRRSYDTAARKNGIRLSNATARIDIASSTQNDTGMPTSGLNRFHDSPRRGTATCNSNG